MEISKLCYELYKIDWESRHGITAEHKRATVIDYHKGLLYGDYDEDYTYEDYMNEYGYDGELYVCYNEFLDTEYLDEDYMYSLLKGNTKLIKLYYKDVIEKEESNTNTNDTKFYDDLLMEQREQM